MRKTRWRQRRRCLAFMVLSLIPLQWCSIHSWCCPLYHYSDAAYIHGAVPYTTTVMQHTFKLNNQAGILDEKRLINVGLLGYYTVYDNMVVSTFRINVLPPGLGWLWNKWMLVTNLATFLQNGHICSFQSLRHLPELKKGYPGNGGMTCIGNFQRNVI
jgi:hypothetical protein